MSEHSEKTENTKRPTIGLLIETVEGIGSSQYPIWEGVVVAAMEAKVNLICFSGGMLDEKNTSRNAIYAMVPGLVDGIIVNGSISNTVADNIVKNFLMNFKNIPYVSIANPFSFMDAYHKDEWIRNSVLMNNEQGIKKLMEHLIQVHDKRRIAFIRGPKNNYEADERYQIYCKMLKDYDIKYNNKLVVAGNFLSHAGREAIIELIKSGEKFNAVVVANDNMAIAAIQTLWEYKKRVPDDVAVVGYDNIDAAQITNPPLTTIFQDRLEQARKALNLLLEMINEPKRTQSGHVLMPTELIRRRSCGCEENSENGYEANDESRAIMAKIIKMEDCLRNSSAAGETTDIRILKNDLEKCKNELSEKDRVALREKRNLMCKKIHAEDQSSVLRLTNEELTTASDIKDLIQKLKKILDNKILLDIQNCYIVLFKNDNTFIDITRSFNDQKNQIQIFDELKVIFAYSNANKIEEGKVYSASDLFKTILFCSEKAQHIVIEPLCFRENLFGFAIFGIGTSDNLFDEESSNKIISDGIIYEALRGHISNALNIKFLNEKYERIINLAAELHEEKSMDIVIKRVLEFINQYFNACVALYIADDSSGYKRNKCVPGNLAQQMPDSFISQDKLNAAYACIPINLDKTGISSDGHIVLEKNNKKTLTDSEKNCLNLLANMLQYVINKRN